MSRVSVVCTGIGTDIFFRWVWVGSRISVQNYQRKVVSRRQVFKYVGSIPVRLREEE